MSQFHVRMAESYEGIVEDVDGDRVVVVYDVRGAIVEQTYERGQFIDGHLPDVGTRLAVFVNVVEIQPDPAGPWEEASDSRHDPALGRRKSIKGRVVF